MTIKTNRNQGFTLIELLVVITIIAILATVSSPLLHTAQIRARMIPATNNARNVVMALTSYAGENAGLYPEGEASSNEALAKLLPDYCPTEDVFYLKSDRIFCTPDSPPDNKPERLAAGECHWAYVSGLTDGNAAHTPIITDAFTAGIGKYDDRHVWERVNKVIVGRLDGSVTMESLSEDGEVLASDKKTNLFETPEIVDDEVVKVLNPLKRRMNR